MPKSNNQKMKLWYVYKILFENSDEQNPLTMPQIIKSLEAYDIKAERKSVYSDIELLINAGVDIVAEKRDKYVYYIASRDFQLAELKLLVDCVQASKFITAKKSNELIGKLETLASKNQARQLQRQVYISERVKTFNEKIYYNIDFLHNAVNSGNKIKFRYYQYSTGTEKKFKNNGDFYIVSPYGMVYSDDNYYLLAHYPKHQGLANFRVDKMTDIVVLDERTEPVNSVMGDKFSIAEYTKKMFNMFHGETKMVQFLCKEEVLNVVIDKFGENLFLRKADDSSYYVTAKVDISPTFYSWVFTLGNKIKIISPDEVVLEYKKALTDIDESYK